MAGKKKRGWTRLSLELRGQVMRLGAQGYSYRQVAGEVRVSVGAVGSVLGPLGGVIRKEQLRPPSPSRLSLEERVEIRIGLGSGESMRGIAARLGRAPSTISREVTHSGGVGGYRPMAAHKLSLSAATRPKQTKLAKNPDLLARVIADLERWWSPQQIAARLAVQFGDDEDMRISHETIYKSLYLQGRGELRRELARCLRSGRQARKSQGRTRSRPIADMTMISQRPAEVDDRAVPGNWEGDLIVGQDGKSAIGTMVERTTRFVMLLHLPNGRSADAVRAAMTAKIRQLPAHLARSITWDQGREMAGHAQFRIDTGVTVYFCDPHSPWQRGTNENTNGLLRQYFPKGTDLSQHSEADLDAAAASLNARPRQTLRWMTPAEKLDQLLVATTD